MEAVAAGPARAADVVTSRAKPPERRREESDNYSEIFRNKIINLVNNCHTASPPTTGKLTENRIINISHYFLVVGIIFSFNELKRNIQSVC